MSGDPSAPVRRRCCSCGRSQDAAATQCASCGTGLQALCGCGTVYGVYDEGVCAKCGAARTPRRSPRMPVVYSRRAKLAARLAVVACIVWVVAAPRPKPAWKLKAEARELFRSGQVEKSMEVARRATVESPSDAEAWMMLAECARELRYDAETQILCAEQALSLRPSMAEALCFLAEAEADRGRLQAAIEYAESAALLPLPPARAYALLGEFEMRRPQPNYARVVAALQRARDGGASDPRVTLRLAEARLQVYGAVAPDALPAGVRTVLDDAEAALAKLRAQGGDTPPLLMLQARLRLALADANRALESAEAVLAAIGPGADPEARSQALIVRGKAHFLLGQASQAALDMGAALELAPDVPTAFAVTEHSVRVGGLSQGEAILRAAAARADPKGAIHAALAWLLFSAHKLPDAAEAAARSRKLAPDDPFYAVIEGDILAAQDRPDAARASYADAIRFAPGFRSPELRIALLATSARGGEEARTNALRAAIVDVERLAARFPEDAEIFDTLGLLHTALRQPIEARDAFERAVTLRPVDPDLWVRFARACRERGGLEAGENAAAAFSRARALRPPDRELLLEEARARIDAGDEATAVEICSRYLVEHARDAQVLALRADAARRIGRYDAAIGDLQLARRIAREDSGREDDAALVALVDTQFRAGRREEAMSLVDTAPPSAVARLTLIAQLHSGDVDGAIRDAEARGAASFAAELQLASGRIDDALATARGRLATAPGDPQAVRVLVLALLSKGDRPAAWLDEARQAVARLPERAPPGVREFLLGRLALAAGDAAGAATLLKTAAAELGSDPLVVLSLGEAMFLSGERSESLAHLRRAAFMPGARPIARTILSNRLLEAGRESRRPQTAMRLAQEALRCAPWNGAAVVEVTRLLHARGEYRRAAVAAEAALAPGGPPSAATATLRRRAVVARLFAGDTSRALELVKGLDAAERDGPFGLVVTGFARLREGRLDEAQAAFASARGQDADSPLAATGLVQVAARRGDPAAAEEVVAAWRAAHPDDRDVELAAAQALAEAGRVDAAIEMARRCADGRPSDWRTALHLIDLLGRDGRGQEAARVAQRLAESAPEGTAPDARLLCGEVALVYRSDPAAALSVARAVQRTPGGSDATCNRARLLEAEALAAAGRTAEARPIAQELLRAAAPDEDPGLSIAPGVERRAQFVVGLCLLAEDRPAEAAKAFIRCVEIDPDDRPSLNNLAWALSKNVATSARALEIATRLTALEPGNANYWDTRATAAEAGGDFADAEASLRRAFDVRDPRAGGDDASRTAAAVRLAGLLRQSGRGPEAREVLQNALELTDETRSPARADSALEALAALDADDPAHAARAFAALSARSTVVQGIALRFLLWQESRDPSLLLEAKRRLDLVLATTPEPLREALVMSVPIHRQIAAAAQETGL